MQPRRENISSGTKLKISKSRCAASVEVKKASFPFLKWHYDAVPSTEEENEAGRMFVSGCDHERGEKKGKERRPVG